MRNILNTSGPDIHQRVRDGQILAARTDDGTLVFPTFQFKDHQVIPGILAVAEPLLDWHVDPWAVFDWFTTPARALHGRTPATVIRDSAFDLDDLIELASDTARRWTQP